MFIKWAVCVIRFLLFHMNIYQHWIIIVAFLFHSSDLGNSKFSNKTMFASLITDLIDLQENGITITVN